MLVNWTRHVAVTELQCESDKISLALNHL